jgi:hypothetical protein
LTITTQLKHQSTDLKIFGKFNQSRPDQVTRQDLANELWNVCEMLPMALESNEEYPITFWWPFASGGR